MRLNSSTNITLALGACLALAATGHAAKKPMHMKAKPMGGSSALLDKGKAIVDQQRCNGCHAANLNGKKGFSPSLHESGVLKEYNQKSFERVMDTGVTNDGGMVRKPMPVYHLKAADSDALYAYFKSLK